MRAQVLIAAVLSLLVVAAFMRPTFVKFNVKGLLRTAAILSFGFCFAGGFWLLSKAIVNQYDDMFLLATLGLIFIGIAFFIGGVLLVAAERLPRKDEGR